MSVYDRHREKEAAEERQRMPYVQIDTDVWAVMRNSAERPAALIYCIADRRQIEQYLVMTWHPEPHRRRLIAMYDTLREANHSVKWDNSEHRTGREDFVSAYGRAEDNPVRHGE